MREEMGRIEPCRAADAEVVPDGFTGLSGYTIRGFNDSADPGWGIANIDWIRANKHVLYDSGMVDTWAIVAFHGGKIDG